MDLLEHVSDDRLVLEEIYRVLRHKGIAVITVPAFRFLWSSHDNVLMHYRRYQQKELRNKLKNSKFTILKISYYNCFLFPIIAGIRLLKNLISKMIKNKSEETDITYVPKAINRLLVFVLKLEKSVLKHLDFPFGVSLISVVRK